MPGAKGVNTLPMELRIRLPFNQLNAFASQLLTEPPAILDLREARLLVVATFDLLYGMFVYETIY